MFLGIYGSLFCLPVVLFRVMFKVFALSLFLAPLLSAIPNSVFGGIVSAQSPLDGVDFTEPLIAALNGGDLLGDWQDEASVSGTRSAYLLARPKVFNQEALLVRGLWREEKLEEVQITFNDAGSYFGYFEEEVPAALKGRERGEFVKVQSEERREEFAILHEESYAKMKEELAARAANGKGKALRFGKSRTIRAEVLEYLWEGVSAHLFHGPDRLVRVTLGLEGERSEHWMDREVAELNDREYEQWLRSRTVKKDSGDQVLEGMIVVPQGYRPYCGLNTLVMAGRYLGLHLDEDWLASAGKFQNTGSAAGSQMLSLYGSVASEAGVKMKRLNQFDATLVKRSLRDGLPVIVWRRWSRDRDVLHTRMSRLFSRGEEAKWGEVVKSELPNKKSPLHASVIVGFNEERNEFLFLESWASLNAPRRMLAKELEATSYLTFCFQN